MTTKKILKGLEHRLENLTKALDVLSKDEAIPKYIFRDYAVRLDEVEVLILWIKGQL
jgi:hypothetical protein